jgi:hypothetical protein|nr:MAG TPA: Transcriptional regulator, RHH-like, CopG [Caudoviricetes sp.]
MKTYQLFGNEIKNKIEEGVIKMLRTKVTEKKEISFDEKVYEDLKLLAENTNRTVEDLINIMATELLQENKQYFVRYILVDHFWEYLNGTVEEESCEAANIKVKLSSFQEDRNTYCKMHCVNKDIDGSILEDYEQVYNLDSDSDMEELEKELENIAYIHIDRDHPDVKNYLEHRMDYC